MINMHRVVMSGTCPIALPPFASATKLRMRDASMQNFRRDAVADVMTDQKVAMLQHHVLERDGEGSSNASDNA